MNDDLKIISLKNELEKSLAVRGRLADFINRYRTGNTARGIEEAMIISQALSNYYTCLETVFLRISRFFENSLPPERWHRELLERMTIQIDGVRLAVIDDETKSALMELLKFRHFSRYYFELDYDWDKLDFLLKKFAVAESTLPGQLARFIAFLNELAGKEGGNKAPNATTRDIP